MTHTEKAGTIFGSGLNCAQAVFGTFAEELGVSENEALRIAACFGGGMQKGDACGAVTGALMALGLRYEGTVVSRPESNAAANEFIDRFVERCGAMRCEELLGYIPHSPEGKERAQQRGSPRDPRCIGFIMHATKVLEAMLYGNAEG